MQSTGSSSNPQASSASSSSSISRPRCASTEGIFLILCFIGWLFTVTLPDLLSMQLPIIPLEAPLGYLLGDNFLLHAASTSTSSGSASSYWSESFRLDLQRHSSNHGRRNTAATVPEPPPLLPHVVLAGMVKSLTEVRATTWDLLADLSCQYNVSVHIIAAETQGSNDDASSSKARFCAPLWIQPQEELLMNKDNQTIPLPTDRIARIASIRDAQRRGIQTTFFPGNHSSYASSFVIVADLDLYIFPTAAQIMGRIHSMLNDSNQQHLQAVCGSGNWYDHPRYNNASGEEVDPNNLFYYDTLALVFWPDTWAVPLKSRLIPHNYQGEDRDIIPVSVKYLKNNPNVYTQYDTMKLIQQQAASNPNGLFPVRSCFGGLALYRAAAWLTPTCQYSLSPELERQTHKRLVISSKRQHETTIFRYAKRKYRSPCEHVVLHDCLQQTVFQATSDDDRLPAMAIDPHLLAHWKKGEAKE